MQFLIFGPRRARTALGAIATTLMSGCVKMHVSVPDETAGINGGFEVVKSGLPVNWLLYAPTTVPQGDYDLVIDTVQFRGGKQSLKFDVRQCSDDGGWHSPGFSREFKATPGTTYTVGFWVKNDGAEFVAKVGGVSQTYGRYETIVRSRDSIPTWKYYEHTYTVPQGFGKLRFEVNVLRPGTFWIDEVTITGIDS